MKVPFDIFIGNVKFGECLGGLSCCIIKWKISGSIQSECLIVFLVPSSLLSYWRPLGENYNNGK